MAFDRDKFLEEIAAKQDAERLAAQRHLESMAATIVAGTLANVSDRPMLHVPSLAMLGLEIAKEIVTINRAPPPRHASTEDDGE